MSILFFIFAVIQLLSVWNYLAQAQHFAGFYQMVVGCWVPRYMPRIDGVNRSSFKLLKYEYTLKKYSLLFRITFFIDVYIWILALLALKLHFIFFYQCKCFVSLKKIIVLLIIILLTNLSILDPLDFFSVSTFDSLTLFLLQIIPWKALSEAPKIYRFYCLFLNWWFEKLGPFSK